MSSPKIRNVTVVNHPLAQDKLWHLRNKHTPPDNFRRLVYELSHIMGYEMAREFKTKNVKVETPVGSTSTPKITETMAIVPIMRAGQAMVDGILDLMPTCAVGHIGIYRDKFVNNTVEYYFRLPQGIEGMRVAVLDPLLATGETAIAAITRLKEYKVGPISFVAMLAAEEGLKKFHKAHPDVHVYVLSIEPTINDQGYIVPGIGDAGDRIYGSMQTHHQALGLGV
jgi:uracil phosphoribosyltransferase